MKLLAFLKNLLFGLLRGIGWTGALAAGAGLLTAGGTYAWLEQRHAAEKSRVQVVKSEVAKLDKEIAEVNQLGDMIQRLLVRKQMMDALDPVRMWPVRLFDQLARLRPQGVYLVSASEFGPRLQLAGYAATYGDVASLVRNLAESPHFERPKLIEVRTEATPNVAGYPVRFGIAATIRGRQGSAQAMTAGVAGAAPNPGDPK